MSKEFKQKLNKNKKLNSIKVKVDYSIAEYDGGFTLYSCKVDYIDGVYRFTGFFGYKDLNSLHFDVMNFISKQVFDSFQRKVLKIEYDKCKN